MAAVVFAYDHSRDPMNSAQLADQIARDLNLTTNPDVGIDPVQITVTHASITNANKPAIQALINAYVYDPVVWGGGIEGVLRQKAVDAIVVNRAYLAVLPPNQAQLRAQVAALTRQNDALIRLVAGVLDFDERNLMAPYAGTLATITANVIAKLRLDATQDEASVIEAINLAHQQAVQETGALQQTATSALTADEASYALPAEVAWIRIITIGYPDGTFTDPLQQVTLEQIQEQRRATAASGQQVVRPLYALAGQNQLELWPTPTAGQVMSFVYVYLPDALVDDADVPAIMEPYGSQLLTYGACVELGRFKKDPLLADYEQAYQMWMTRFQLWLNRREGSSARTFRIGTTGGRVRLADRSADVA